MTRRALLLAGAAIAALTPASTVASVPGGGPRLEDFRIDDRGTVTQPAPTPPAPAPAPTPAPSTADERPPAPTPAPRPAPAQRRTEPPRAAPTPTSEPPVADSATPEPDPPAQPVTTTPLVPAPQADGAPSPPTQPKETRPEPEGGPIWPWLLIPLALLGIGGLAWSRRGRSAEPTDSIDLVDERPKEASAPAPLTPSPVPAPRPRIELALDPEAATLQDGALEVRFLLRITNAGDVPAEEIRVASKLLSGGQEIEDALASFYADPLTNAVRLPQAVLASASFGLRGRVRSKGEALRALMVRDRALLVPLVAVNLRYRWADGEGQTARSFVLGRELDPPAERMAALPATASPRVYRGLGTRPHALAKVA